MSNQIFITKHNGERELFSPEKLMHSMKRVGIPRDEYSEILSHVETKLYDGIPTEEIFSHVREHIGKKNKEASIRFNLKHAIFDLGPTGFPFEKYIGRIFQDAGYKTTIDKILQGECVTHEVDIILEKNGVNEMVEVKFHNEPVMKTDIHVVMYTLARYWDLREGNHLSGVWVVTNTKLSEDAIKYAKCKGIKVIAWNFPENGNLQDFVEKPKMYPITILPLSTDEKEKLLADNVVLCCDFLDLPQNVLRDKYFIREERLLTALEQAKLVCARK